MLTELKVGPRKDLCSKDFIQMLKLRYKVFIKRLHWNLSASNVEYDQYDLCNPTYIIIGNPIVATCRLLPTTGRYMLSELWPGAVDNKAPNSPHIWELSRLAVDKTINGESAKNTALLFKSAYDFAIANNIQTYVIVICAAIERLLTRLGLILKRIGSVINADGSKIVACMVEVDDKLRDAIESIA